MGSVSNHSDCVIKGCTAVRIDDTARVREECVTVGINGHRYRLAGSSVYHGLHIALGNCSVRRDTSDALACIVPASACVSLERVSFPGLYLVRLKIIEAVSHVASLAPCVSPVATRAVKQLLWREVIESSSLDLVSAFHCSS